MAQEIFSQEERDWFSEGTFYDCQARLGAHLFSSKEGSTCRFTIWAPRVSQVWVTGSFNQWRPQEFSLERIEDSDIWTREIVGIQVGDYYKFVLETQTGELLFKADPFAFTAELPPGTASKVWPIKEYAWQDWPWMRRRNQTKQAPKPFHIYEVHAGSWQRHEKNHLGEAAFYSWRELAQTLIPYVKEMSYTHVELLPIMEESSGSNLVAPTIEKLPSKPMLRGLLLLRRLSSFIVYSHEIVINFYKDVVKR